MGMINVAHTVYSTVTLPLAVIDVVKMYWNHESSNAAVCKRDRSNVSELCVA